MRNLLIFLIAALFVSPVIAQPLHQATPFEELLQQYRDAHPDDPMVHMSHDMDMGSSHTSSSSAPLEQVALDISATATKIFSVTARQWAYTINPSSFVVNQGDTVTLTLTSSDVEHGFFLESYMTNGVNLRKGTNETVSFVANTPGTFTFFCTVSSCGSGHSRMTGTFTVTAVSNPAPTISTFTPVTGPTAGGTNVLIQGTNFGNNATVKFGTVAAVSANVNNATSINATAPAQGAGAVSITVTNPDGQSATSPAQYTYAVPAPTISSFTPASGSTAGGTSVQITGTNFSNGATVKFGGAGAAATTVNSATSITATTPPAGAGSVTVAVTNPDGQSATSSALFTFAAPPASLAVTTISPANGSPAGGTPVTINGTGFSGSGFSVTFGGVAATSVQITSATSLSVVTPPHAAGTVDVVVTAGSSSATAAGAFTYQDAGKRRRAVKTK